MFAANEIGAFVRWLLKGCKTSLEDELMEDNKNLLAALITSLLFVAAIALFF